MVASRRQFIIAAGAVGLAGSVRAAALSQVSPEMFGAKGDWRTNDTRAFAAMSAHLNAAGGGTIVLRPTTYIVGDQHPSAGGNSSIVTNSFTASDIIHLAGCSGPIRIEGRGATLRCASGLRYGRFEPGSGKPFANVEKLTETNEAVPYVAFIHIEKCSGGIEISDLELDGNLKGLWIGGNSGRGGWQAGGTGIILHGNTGPERLSRIHSHHHAQDGMILTPALHRAGATSVVDCICEYNGRQGCSVTGGRNFLFQRCFFRHTGRAILHSAPGAGVDIEAENWPIRDVAFENCEFSDNAGFGLTSGSGDSADVSCNGCKFVGTTNWAAWPDSPGMRFSHCVFAGPINHCHGDVDPSRAVHFMDCAFTDDHRLSPTGKLFLGKGKEQWIAIVLKSPNVRFDRCRFHLTGDTLLPLSDNGVIYADCEMSQRSPTASGPLGTYIGTNSISGKADLLGAIIRGRVVVNGRVLPRTA